MNFKKLLISMALLGICGGALAGGSTITLKLPQACDSWRVSCFPDDITNVRAIENLSSSSTTINFQQDEISSSIQFLSFTPTGEAQSCDNSKTYYATLNYPSASYGSSLEKGTVVSTSGLPVPETKLETGAPATTASIDTRAPSASSPIKKSMIITATKSG